MQSYVNNNLRVSTLYVLLLSSGKKDEIIKKKIIENTLNVCTRKIKRGGGNSVSRASVRKYAI